jgi:hypothetical protein
VPASKAFLDTPNFLEIDFRSASADFGSVPNPHPHNQWNGITGRNAARRSVEARRRRFTSGLLGFISQPVTVPHILGIDGMLYLGNRVS